MSPLYTFMYILCLSSTVGVSDAFWTKAARFLTHRQCNIVLRNHCTTHELRNPLVHMVSGKSSVPLPRRLGPDSETHVEFRKTAWAARGAVGVFTYDLVNIQTRAVDKRMAFMFSVPFSYVFHSNWFAAGFFSKKTQCDRPLYKKMYHEQARTTRTFVRSKAGRLITHKDGQFTVKATMVDNRAPDMTVDVYDG